MHARRRERRLLLICMTWLSNRTELGLSQCKKYNYCLKKKQKMMTAFLLTIKIVDVRKS